MIVSCLLPGFQFERATQGLLGEGQRLARQLEMRHVIIVADNSEETELAQVARCGNSVVVASSEQLAAGYQPEACLHVLHHVCQELHPVIVLLGDETYGQELTPRLAHRLQGSSAGDAQAVHWKDDRFHVTRSVYGGKATAVVRMNQLPAVVWLRTRSFAAEPPRDISAEIERRAIKLDDAVKRRLEATEIIQRQQEDSHGERLEDARVIVSGGRGLGGPEPFAELRKLAEPLGAQVAASRAACDAGWVPPNWQVGQTGRKVAPDLYLAVAISGASQHIMGIADAKVIAAINTDPDAPIYGHCAFGLVEDYRNVVGPLAEKLAVLRGQR